jgi:protein gp37
MAKTTIEWTETTWNPCTGCTKISSGCKNCYAATMAKRLKAMDNPRYLNGFEFTIHEDKILEPYQWKKPKKIFVNSMSDLFHENSPSNFIEKVFQTMNGANWHIYQLLTKRSERLAELSSNLVWSSNIWMGVSVEDQRVIHRIDDLRKCGAAIKFLSLEPLLGPLPNLNLQDIDWVIVGGESGPRARPMEKVWVEDIQRQCAEQNVSFFFKQWGGVQKKKTGRLLNGRTWDEMPIPKHIKV